MPKLGDVLNEQTWCQGSYGQLADGSPCDVDAILDGRATKMCLVGALCKVVGKDVDSNFEDSPELIKMDSIVGNIHGKTIGSFNDSPTTTFKDVKDIIEAYDNQSNT